MFQIWTRYGFIVAALGQMMMMTKWKGATAPALAKKLRQRSCQLELVFFVSLLALSDTSLSHTHSLITYSFQYKCIIMMCFLDFSHKRAAAVATMKCNSSFFLFCYSWGFLMTIHCVMLCFNFLLHTVCFVVGAH